MTLQSYKNIIRLAQYDIFFALGIDKKVVLVNYRPCEPEIPFGPQVPPSPFNTVFSVSAVPFRHRSLAKRNGAFAVRYCLCLRVTRSIVNHYAIGTPGAVNHCPGEQPMHHSVWPKMVQRETQVQTTTCKTGFGL